MSMTQQEWLGLLRNFSVKSATWHNYGQGDQQLSSIEFFEGPGPTLTTTQLDQLITPTETKEEGICAVRGCSNANGGAMNGSICPEMCRDHALQMGGARHG